MAQAFSGVFNILLLCLVGFFLSKRGFIDEHAEDFMTRLASKVAIPCMLFANAVSNITLEFLRSTGLWMLVPFLSILLLYNLAYVVARILKIKRSDYGVFRAMFAMPNTLTIGLPITLSIFGESGVPFVMAYYVATALFFWSYAVTNIAKDAGHVVKGTAQKIKRIFSPSLIGLLLGTSVNLLGLPLPSFMLSAVSQLGAMTTPLSLLITGGVIAKMGKEVFVMGREGAATLVGRFVVSPLVCILICVGFSAPPAMAGVYVIQSGLPSMNQVMLMSKYYGANERLGAQMLTVTSLLSVVVIPALVFIINIVFGL